MKTKLTFEFNSIEEAQSFLASQGGGHKVEVAASTTTAAPVEADPNDLSKKTKTELQALCDQRALAYAGRATKKDLIDLLEGRTQPVKEEVQVAAPVVEPEVVVPQANVQPLAPAQPAINEAPAQVQEAVVVDTAALIANFTDAYNHTMAAGVSAEQLQGQLGQILTDLGAPGVRLSQLPGHILDQAVGSFRAYCGELLNLTQQAAPAQSNAFI